MLPSVSQWVRQLSRLPDIQSVVTRPAGRGCSGNLPLQPNSRWRVAGFPASNLRPTPLEQKVTKAELSRSVPSVFSAIQWFRRTHKQKPTSSAGSLSSISPISLISLPHHLPHPLRRPHLDPRCARVNALEQAGQHVL